jgi:hypothetical protein
MDIIVACFLHKCIFHSSTVVQKKNKHHSSGTRTMEQGTIVAMKLCKLISSPDSEMDRGPQHAGKAGVGSKI